MELRDITPEELDFVRKALGKIPEPHRSNINMFTASKRVGETKGYHLIGDRWMVDDSAEAVKWDDYYCPSEDRITLCPGPCPDGREHIVVDV